MAMKIGERIRMERERKGWTQEEMASRCGYKGRSSISKIEASGDDITSKKVRRCAEVLNVPVSYLMGWEARSSIEAMLNEKLNDEQRKEISANISYTSANYEEMNEMLDVLHSRPEMKILFKAAGGATKEQIESVAKLLESFKKE